MKKATLKAGSLGVADNPKNQMVGIGGTFSLTFIQRKSKNGEACDSGQAPVNSAVAKVT